MEYKYAVEVAQDLKQQLENGNECIANASQHDLDVEAWEYFLKIYRPNEIIELGTGDGAFSNWLAERVENFSTFDNREPRYLKEEIKFEKIDIFEEKEKINSAIRGANLGLVLYCDNGDKAREVREFSDLLGAYDFLATHDYQIEIKKEDIPERFELIYNRGLTAFFKLGRP